MSNITYKVAVRYQPSKNRQGSVNILNAANESMSCDPLGNISWKAGADGNYEQFKIVGQAFEIAPGDDQNPAAPTIRFLPSEV